MNWVDGQLALRTSCVDITTVECGDCFSTVPNWQSFQAIYLLGWPLILKVNGKVGNRKIRQRLNGQR